MGYTRGRFGVEYQARETAEAHRLRRVVVCAVVLVLIAFSCHRISKFKSDPKPVPVNEVVPAVTISETMPSAVEAQKRPPSVKPKPTPESRVVERWLETARNRPDKERILLERLAEAERQNNILVAIDAIKKLYTRPTMADLQDPLVRRLGDLNYKLMFSGAQTPWTALVKAKRGDSRDRIAREYRTTPAAVQKLNPGMNWSKLKPGDTVRVLDFPNAVLVVYKQRGYADLSLKNGQLFRRYYVSISKETKDELYPIANESGSTASERFRALGMKVAPKDREELEMFLGAGSRITVSDF